VKALAPGFLIAMPQLLDSNFERTVVLMLEHSDEGSMGLIINKRVPITLSELGKNQSLEVSQAHGEEPVFLGGPVEPYRGFVLHDSDKVDEKSQVLPGLFLSVTPESLKPLLTDDAVRVRFCLGYAGWGPGQVEKELADGSWLFTEATTRQVLTPTPEAVWEEVIKSMGVDPAMLVKSQGVN